MPRIDGQDYDKVLFGCKPIDPGQYAGIYKRMWEAALASGIEIPPDYPGRIVKQCEACQIDVQVGPRQQEYLKTGGEATIYCLVCAVLANQEADLTVHDLGNPYKQNRT